MNKSLFFVFLLLALTFQQTIRIPSINLLNTTIVTPAPTTPAAPVTPAISPINLVINKNITNIILRTQTAFIYHGIVDIQITQGQQENLDFFVQFVPETQCNWTKCFTGWVINYTQIGQDPVLGYPDGKLDVNPIFSFNTNSEQDFQIIRSHQLSQVWAQIIQVACQKLNPQLVASSSLRTVSTRALIINPNSNTSNVSTTKYSFKDPTLNVQSFLYINENVISQNFASFSKNQNFVVQTAIKGDLLATLSTPIALEGFDVKNSAFGQQILLNQDLLVKQRLINYDFSLKSDNANTDQGLIAPDFAGRILIGLNLVQTTSVLITTVSKVKSDLATLVLQDDSFNFRNVQTRRLNFGYSFNPQQPILPAQPNITQTFANEVYSGIDVAKLFNGDALTPSSTLPVNQLQTNIANIRGSRLLQLLAVYTIYNYNKVLFSKTIFGKLFQVSVEVNCYLLIYPTVHNIQCTGIMKYDLFSKSKQITIFNFVKSVTYAWSYTTQFKGSWGFSIYIPLPPPVSFLGINFAFNVGYVIDLSVGCSNNAAVYPYKIVVRAVASTAITTDASAAVRAIVIQGGVFISGNLVKLRTDPTLTLSYYWFYTKKINIWAQWNFQIFAFQYDWGFFYRYWTFWSGWSGRKIIAKWTINGLYGKYGIINKSWNIYY